jgi:hypothetical protein
VPSHGTETNPLPFRVVAPLLQQDTEQGKTKLKLYVLMNQIEGLCTPYVIHQDEVFYFNEFRTAATSNDERRQGWNRIVRGKALGLGK